MQEGSMGHRKRKSKFSSPTQAAVSKEMAKPRVTKSARIDALNLDTTRTPEPPSTTVPGNVEKIIPPVGANKPEQAQIATDETSGRHRDFRIENTLTDEHGEDIKLKKGARVEVTVKARNAGSKSKISEK
jgi:phage gp45-like